MQEKVGSHVTRDTSGKLSVAGSRDANQSFNYETKSPHPKNWIGVYNATEGGPDDEKYVQDSLAWAYAPESHGTVEVSTFNLPPGKYKAYLLKDEGYKWLAKPVQFEYSGTWGHLSVKEGQPLLTFEYSTNNPDPMNWIAMYHEFGGGPVNQKFDSPSLTWSRAPEKNGTVTVDVSNLQQGMAYKVFFLYKDGYKWLASPIKVFNPGTGPLRFITDKFTTQNAQQGEKFEATITGMLANPRDDKTRFARLFDISNNSTTSDWINVSSSGVLSGTPPKSAKNTTITVEAQGSNGSKAQLKVNIPVMSGGAQLVNDLTVLSFNLWFGGTQVKNYHEKQVRFIAESGSDIVGLQESTGGHAIRLAQALGWDHWQAADDIGMISRYPMKQFIAIERAAAAHVQLGKDNEIIFWNCHLGYDPYGPYDFCYDHQSPEQVLKNETKSRRTPQIQAMMKEMKSQLKHTDKVPIVLTGDFNAPSHLDWTEKTKKLHCGVGYFPWPTSKYPVDAGLVDSYREVHKDVIADPGITWSPIFLDNNGRPEPLDRIDFIYHKGLKTRSSEVVLVGKPKAEPNHADNEWTSDHAAVKSVFQVVKGEKEPEHKNHSGVIFGVIGGVLAAIAACASLIVCSCVKRRKAKAGEAAGKPADDHRDSESSDTQ